MKTSMFKIIFSVFALLIVQNSWGQQINERSVESDEGSHNAYVIVVENVNEKMATDVWDSYIKDHKSKIKRIRKSKVKLSENVAVPGLSGKVHIKSSIVGLGKSAELTLWFIQDGIYLSSSENADSYEQVDQFIDNYFVALDIAEVKEEVDQEENKLKNLEKELEKLQKDNEKLHKEIQKAEETIRQGKEEIEINLQDQKSMESKIDDQKGMVNKTKDKLSKIK